MTTSPAMPRFALLLALLMAACSTTDPRTDIPARVPGLAVAESEASVAVTFNRLVEALEDAA